MRAGPRRVRWPTMYWPRPGWPCGCDDPGSALDEIFARLKNGWADLAGFEPVLRARAPVAAPSRPSHDRQRTDADRQCAGASAAPPGHGSARRSGTHREDH